VKSSRLRSVSYLLAILLVALVMPLNAQASVKVGSACKVAGASQRISGQTYTCSLVNKKLVWRIKPAPVPEIFVGLTWAQIAAEKDAAAAKIAEEERLNQEAVARALAEAKAAAELKAKQEAEAVAAKAEAEKPKVQGLVIGNLLWSDDFKGSKDSSINSKNWSARNCHRTPFGMGGGACFDSEVVYYAPSAIKLDGSQDGVAVISTTRIKGPLPSDAGTCLTSYCAFVSGRFDTHGKVAFQYGFIEARIKMPAGSGNHPAFWMLGDNINQVGWPTSGEMDITEIRGNDPYTTTSATHYSTSYLPNTCCFNHRYNVASLGVGADVSAGFHTYAVAWLPDSISYYVDNRLISTTTPQNVGAHWGFNDKFFLILNNAVNANFSGSWENLQSSTMTIDWVRSYQLNGQGQVFNK
jgi:beta-glucanase (GH16 family)